MLRKLPTRRRFLKGIGAAAVGAAMMPFPGALRAQTSLTPLKIALIASVSGQGQRGGGLNKVATELAVSTLNAAGGIGELFEVELIVEDNQTSETESVNAANRLINRGDISFVIGPQRTNEILPVQPVLAAAQIPHIMLASTDRTLTDQHDSAPLSLRYSPQDIMQMAPVAKYATTVAGHKSFYALGSDTGDGRAAVTSFESIMEPLGGTLEASEFYPFGNREFSTLVAKFKDSGADALLVSDGLPTSVIALLNEFVLQGLSLDRFFGSIVFSGDTFYNQVAINSQAEGIIFPWFYDDGTGLREFDGPPVPREAAAMNAAFETSTGEPAGGFATPQAWAWGGVNLIQQSIEALIAQEGADVVAGLDLVNEMPQAVVNQVILNGASGESTGPKFSLTFGDEIGFFSCGQADVRCGPGTYRNGQLVLLEDRNWADELVGDLCG